jgi:hypothetical protein
MEDPMPRIIVTSDPTRLPDHVAVLLDEHVQRVHLSDDHAAAQLVERIAWAISDAEDTEDAWQASRAPASALDDRGPRRSPRSGAQRPRRAVRLTSAA